jgi:diaminobutyrate-2-oxoglutarate transaminase
MSIIECLESNVRNYSRLFPVVFERASGPYIYTRDGRRYIDFFCAAGALNYGHNHPVLKHALASYLDADGVTTSLDMATGAKVAFLNALNDVLLQPRGWDYLVQFTGPTGANAVEAALKLARKVKQRSTVIAFTGAYHGLSLGALAVTAHGYYRDERFAASSPVVFAPFDGYYGPETDTLRYLAELLDDENSGLDRPAAVLVETIQGEGGVNVASTSWLLGLQELCRAHDMVLIVDEVQAGCGRTGTFFSFDGTGLEPDIVVCSKSIGGFGLPLALLLIKPELDRWSPGEHNGTFRGNCHAFVTGTAALELWESPPFVSDVERRGAVFEAALRALSTRLTGIVEPPRGRGFMFGLPLTIPTVAQEVTREAFAAGLLIETCGRGGKVIKLMPPVTTPEDVLLEGVDLLAQSIERAVDSQLAAVAPVGYQS